MAKITVERFVAQLQLAFGAELKAVVLYGSAARGGPAVSGETDVLVLAERITAEMLTREAAIAAAWAEAGNPPPLTMTVREWLGSADIFPMEHADLLEAHTVLFGALPQGAAVERSDLRRQLEHEAMGKVFRLRRGILAAGGEAKRHLALLEESVGAFLVLFRALLRVHGESPPREAEALVAAAAARSGVDLAAFQRVVRHRAGAPKLSRAEAGPVLEAYLAGATALVDHIDRLGAS